MSGTAAYEHIAAGTAAVPVYHGPMELTPPRLLTSWTFDPTMTVLVIALAAGYLLALRASARRGSRVSWGRTAAFAVALVLIVLSSMSFVGVYQHTLFWDRALQVIVLLMVVPLFFALSKPITLALTVLPEAWSTRLLRVIRGRTLKLATFPVFPTALLVGTGFVLYFSPWYAATLRSGTWNHVLFVQLVVSGFPFFWTLMRIDPVPTPYPYLVAVWIAFAEVVFDAALGLSVMLGHPVAPDYYAVVARPWGFGTQRDQTLGGGALWFVGDLVGLPFLVTLFRQMLLEDRKRAREIDRRLDAEAAAARGLSAATATDAAEASDGAPAPARGKAAPVMSRPWWESDPVLAKRYGRPLREESE